MGYETIPNGDHGHVFRVVLGTGLQNHERGFDSHRALNMVA